jgi:cobalamin biosynthetic protein CobC
MNSQKNGSAQARDLRYHGGNVNAARREFPNVTEPWIDLSTGVSPIPYPVGSITHCAWSRLPDPYELAALEAAAHAAYGARSAVKVVAAPGTQALINWLPLVFPTRNVGVLGFTYREHENCWRWAGAETSIVRKLEDLTGFETGIVVNPNNPDGRTYTQDDLAKIASLMATRGGRLIIDEAFMDLMGADTSFVPVMPVKGVLILRSFGKAYGLAGLRLGFALGSHKDCVRLRGAIGPWAVSGPAIEIGRRALADEPWRAVTASRLHEKTRRLDRLLESAGFAVVGGTMLFRLAQHKQASEWYDHLCQAGILTRPFRQKSTWLRFGIPSEESEWERLDAALHSSVFCTQVTSY